MVCPYHNGSYKCWPILLSYKYYIIFFSTPYLQCVISYCKCIQELFAKNNNTENTQDFIFSSPGHRPCELLSWVNVRRPSVCPSVRFSHLNLLLWNRWTEISQTCQKCSLDGPLPDLCFWCWFEIQHGCQGP